MGDLGIAQQFWIQLKAVVLTLAWSGVVAFISYKITGALVGLRPSEENERKGLDIVEHGEQAYDM